MNETQDFPVYNVQNYEGLHQSAATIRISHSMRHSGSAEQIGFPKQLEHQKSRIMKIQCTCNHQQSNMKKSCCNCGTVVCPGPITSTSSRISDQIIKGESRIQYVPYQKKAVDYIDEERYELRQKKRIETDYKEQVRVEYHPKEVTVTDYYAVQYIRCYVPQIIPQKYIECVPTSRTNKKYQYIPVQRQIVHYPVHSHDDEAPRYLGTRKREGPKVYENISEQMYKFWENQYGYKKGDPVSQLNRKIREKQQRQKQNYFERVSYQYKESNKKNQEILSKAIQVVQEDKFES